MRIHTRQEAEFLIYFLNKTISKKAKLIGSFGKGELSSEHDIDVLIPDKKKSTTLRNKLKKLLDAKSYENTDWKGWYFRDTFFGDVDIFFTTKNFDY